MLPSSSHEHFLADCRRPSSAARSRSTAAADPAPAFSCCFQWRRYVPQSDFMPSLLAIVAVALLCGYSLFTLERKLQHPVVDTYLPYGVLGASNSAGVLAMFATPVLAVLAALALADRKRLYGAADARAALLPRPRTGR
jgi:hypothetical protein